MTAGAGAVTLLHVLPSSRERGGTEEVMLNAVLGLGREAYRHVVWSPLGRGSHAPDLEAAADRVLWSASEGEVARVIEAEAPALALVYEGYFQRTLDRACHAYLARMRDLPVAEVLVRVHEPVGVGVHAEAPAVVYAAEHFVPAGAAHRTFVIANGVELPARVAERPEAAARARFDLPAHGVVLGVLGRLHGEKRLGDFVAAARRLRELHGDRVAFVIAGSGPERAALEAEAERCVAGAVRFTGEVASAVRGELLRALDVFLAPTGEEAMPLAILEAMAAGLPVVVYAWPAQREIFRGEDDPWWMVEPGDPGGLAAAASRYAVDRELARGHGARNREIVRQRFSREVMARGYRDLVRAVGRPPGAPPPKYVDAPGTVLLDLREERFYRVLLPTKRSRRDR